MIELFKEIWATVQHNKLRTTLTGFAVGWGIFILIFLLGAGNGLINAQMHQSERFLANSIVVFGGVTSKPHNGFDRGRRISLENRDLLTTTNNFEENIQETGATLWKPGNTFSLGANYIASQNLCGAYPVKVKIDKIEIVHGRFINDIDLREKRKVIVLTQTQAKELSRDVAALLGKYIKVNDTMFRVVGISKDDKSGENNTAHSPFTTISTIYNYGYKVDRIEFTFGGVSTEEESDAFEDRYRASINANHDAASDDESALWVWNRLAQSLQMNKGLSILRTALWIVGLFTLISGIVGVSNIMLITVKERTREFGIRKALGAGTWSILRMIIVESVAITTFFGYLGMLCGVLANEYMNATIGREVVDTGIFQATMFLNPTVGLDVCIQATMVMILAGTIAGLIPALKAASVRPIVALNAK